MQAARLAASTAIMSLAMAGGGGGIANRKPPAPLTAEQIEARAANERKRIADAQAKRERKAAKLAKAMG